MFSKPVKKFLISSIAITGSVFGLGLFLLWAYQDRLLYFPSVSGQYPHDNSPGYRDPGEARLNYEDVKILTSDGINLHGWLVKTQNPAQTPTIVVFQGNAGNIGWRIPIVSHLHRYCDSNVLIVGYRGYSNSEGKPSEKGLQIDSLAIMDHVFSRKDINRERIYIHGTSLGGAVGIYALSHKSYNVAGLILENTFTSISDMVDQVMPAVSKLKRLVLANHWESVHRIAKIKVPILFISGLLDELVPPQQMARLYDAAKESVLREKLGIETGTHNDTWVEGGEIYFKAIKEFMRKAESHRVQEPVVDADICPNKTFLEQ